MKRQPKSDFGSALRRLRQTMELPQEAFDLVSSRTYVSALERNIKVPTLGKIEQLAGVMHVHPITLLSMAYATSPAQMERLLAQVAQEVEAITSR